MDQSAVLVFLENGDGTFTEATTTANLPGGYRVPTPGNIAIADFNGDGKADIAVTEAGFASTVQLFLGNGDGTFTMEPRSPLDSLLRQPIRPGNSLLAISMVTARPT